MKLMMCAVRDVASETFFPPMAVNHTVHAVRSFQQEVNRQAEGNMIYVHPGDFELWLLAEFDPLSGAFVEKTERLLRGIDVRQMAQVKDGA